MRSLPILLLLAFLCCLPDAPVSAQNNACGPEVLADTTMFSGTAFFNYGSRSRANSQKYRTSVAVGQTFVGYLDGLQFNSTVGFYSRFLLPPFELKVKATQGDLLDRIQLSWEIDALGPSPNEGFNIYRDGIFLATVGSNIRTYNDFNVIAGKAYNYEIRGLNLYGEGTAGKAVGFQIPNGTVTGWVQTINGSPVPDALVTLMPTQGFSLKFGPMDGAFAEPDTSGNNFLPASGQDWTMTFWLKTEAATANAGLIQLSPFPLHIRALNSAGGHEGVEIATSPTGTAFLTGHFADATKNGWHHVALSFDGGAEQGRLYIDGVLSALAPMPILPFADTIHLGAFAGTGGWAGRMDELRLYTRRLDELDFGEIMMGTASSLTPNISHYWKFDEELGTKSFDVLNRHPLYFCGSIFDKDHPDVRTAGRTNSAGYYRIESASYGTGTTFLAEPMKDFYLHRALKFVRNEQDYATLPDFSLTKKATLELWVNSAGPDGEQCLISKKWPGNDFRLLLMPNGLMSTVKFYLNGQEHNFGDLNMGYQHLSFTIDSSGNDRIVTAFKNGVPFGTPHTFNGVTGNWSDPAQPWVLGARPSGLGYTDHFGGLIDEVAFYDTTLSVARILTHVQASRNPQERGTRAYFSLDEGSGNRLNNSGSVLTGSGTNLGAAWTPFSPNQMTTPHIFSPATRQVTLNPSVTSVDQVDFTDRSTVAVSGFVRYKNTDCFAENVEILVNGTSFNPRVLTDSTGRFVIDFDPGATATLTPVFEDHVFIPATWEVTNVASPLAGILFTDITTRKVSGQVAGGLCKKSVIKAPPGQGQGTVCVVKVRSVDGCLERIVTIDNQEGNFEFDNLPPIEKMTVAVVEHSDPDIKTAFQVQGGSTVDLSKKDTILDFIYIAQPQIEITSGLDSFSATCPQIVLDQYEMVTLVIKLKEQYVATPSDDGVCYIDTAGFRIINGLGDEVLDTTMSNGVLTYEFRVGTPNPTPPYLKTLQIISTTLDDNEGELTRQAVITGIRAKQNTFTTQLPEIPTMVLRDPPGDGSYAYLEKGEKFCQKATFSVEYSIGSGGGVTFDNGPDVTITFGLGAPNIETETKFGVGTEALVTFSKVTDNSLEVCTTLQERLSTSESELVVGGAHGADIFMGGGINIEFGFADLVQFNPINCEVTDSVVLNVNPEGFATTFMYSEFNIQNNVIRYLNTLADAATDPVDKARYLESAERWEAILENNAQQKATAKFVRNLSFDAGIVYEYSETSDSTESSSSNIQYGANGETVIFAGGEVGGIGIEGKLKVVYGGASGQSDDETTANSIRTGYVLKDNEPGDFFTFDVGMDSVYNTPVFNIKTGQSSCPWEEGTANREGPHLSLAPGSGFVAVDVPANEAAVFQLNLGNLSASNEDWTYGFSAVAANNPHGAVIKLNGAVLNYNQRFIIPYGTSKTVTLTVERGPIEYDYDDLLVALYSECENERNLALSLPLDGDPNFFSPLYLGAHFIRPCSEVNINVPEQDWVIFPDPLTPGPDDTRRITVSGYDTTQVDFQLVRVQYRRADGDGAWINIPGISDRYNPNWLGYAALPNPKPPKLEQKFTQFFWDTDGLSDGPYEIRAVAVCSGDASDKPGYSQIIKGRIDREPPSIIGVPQPSDGVYHVGDEISFTFNQHINCNKLIQADVMNANNVGLYDATTDQLIDANITCFENKVIIEPNFQNEFFENKILRAELHGIQDLTGNTFNGTKFNGGVWEFFVDRNELAWLTDSMGLTKYEGEYKVGTAAIHNRGGYPVPFKITGAPAWVRVVPSAGTLVANQVLPIRFEVDSTLAFGRWSDSITLHTETGQNPFFMGGDEKLPIGVRVVCRPPNWSVNPGAFENSMNMVLKLNIQGQFSTDVEDIVAAYINDELRGRANVRYVPELDAYLAYLTVFGDPADQLDAVRLEIWDASECLRYGTVVESFTFQPDNIIGIPDDPQIIHTSGLVLRDVPFGFGWNWLSFNLAFPDNSINAALASLNHPQNDLMKSQTAFSTYSGGWFGSLNNLGNTTMYIYRADVPDTLQMLGDLIDPATTHLPLVTGWNWIGYVPSYSLPVNEALSSLPSQKGDLIKSQSEFAQYISPAFGWIGNLQYMLPPNGYQIKVAAPGTLTYPPPGVHKLAGVVQNRGGNNQPIAFWTVHPEQFEYSMTLIGMLKVNGQNATTATMELGVFAGTEVRGSTQAIYIAPLNAYLFFLTTYANAGGEQLKFKLFDLASGETGTVQELAETMWFAPDLHQGSIESPIPFTLKTSGIADLAAEQSFDVQPNPFSTETMFRFVLAQAQEVTISVADVSGREVARMQSLARAGLNTVTWNGTSDAGLRLGAGVYLVRWSTEEGIVTRKVVLQR